MAVVRVLLISKTHLDVGFTGLAAEVRQRYLDEFFPRAISVADELRRRGGPERLRWTTGAWILAEALDSGDPSLRRALEAAIDRGDLCWHALPFTMHTEYCDRSLLEHGLSISADLDRRFGRRTVAAKVTDVPGHSRGIVSVLADHGVEFLHVGVNPASSVPDVPERFRWLGGTELDPRELLVMYQAGSYGDVQEIPGTSTAIAVDLTGDNLGPRTADDVIARYAELAARFPGATIEASTLDDAAGVLAGVSDQLPIVTGEIGDTWIQGVGTDPAKTAAFRALCRARRTWIESGQIAVDDPVLRTASTSLLLVAEHTWGLDQKTHWPDTDHWSADELASVRDDPATVRFESSWAEQRRYIETFVQALDSGGRSDLASLAREAVDSTLPRAFVAGRVDRDESAAVTAPDVGGRQFDVGGFQVELDPADGAVIGLVDTAGRRWASPTSVLGRVHLQTYDSADFERWFSTYNGATLPEDLWWARWDNTKPGLSETAAVSRRWSPRLDSVRAWSDGTTDHLGVVLRFDVPEGAAVAPPARVEMRISSWGEPSGQSLEFRLCWFDKPAARWPESTWWTFAPTVADPAGWAMEKLGESVSPFDVVSGGGSDLHCADRLTHAASGIELELVDTALVSPGEPRLLTWSDHEVALDDGWNVCLHDNVWGTNFPMWTEGDAMFRVLLRWAPT